MDDLILVGRISTTHKLFGSLKVLTTFPLLEEIIGQNVIAKKDNDIKVLKIKEIKGVTDKRALFSFDKIDNIDAAKTLLGYNIYIRHDLVPDYEEEESILGYQVYDKGVNIGEVVDILETAAHDILIVKTEDDKEVMIPYIDVFVDKIDDDNQKILVNLIEGMM